MKTRIFSLLSIVALLVMILYSCKDWFTEDFLDRKPLAAWSDQGFYQTMSGVEMATTTCYSMFSMEKLWDLSIMMTMGSIASDEAEAGAGGKADVIEFQEIDQLRHTPESPNVFEWTYGYLYRAVNYCNTALDRIPGISEQTDPAYNEDIVSTRLGEIYFLRAFNYFTLMQIFGGVPLVLHPLLPGEYDVPRAEIDEILAAVKSDLREALGRLREKSQLGSANIGRATKGAARAMLAKVYLYESSYAKYMAPSDSRFSGCVEHWDSAAYWANEVIESDEYELVGINGERWHTWRDPEGVENTRGYQWIFMTGANNSKEEVFSIQSRQDGLGWFRNRGTALVRWCAPRKVGATGTGTDFGWGWWCPSQYLVDSYEPGDPRYNYTVLDSTDSILTTSGWQPPNFVDLRSGTGLFRNSHKYECSPDEFWIGQTDWKDAPTNVKMIRYADLLLFAAEANLELGNTDLAIEYVNMVRERARASGDDPNVLPPLTSITHDDIIHERLVELACEGHRFWDLVRWGLADEYLSAPNNILANGDELDFVPGRHEFYPIPAIELGLNSALEQYPGWYY
jgi:hypothetical protein